MFRKLAASAVLAATAVFAGQAFAETNYEPLQGDPKEINFGIISTESSANLKEQWLPFLKDMESQIGLKVNAFFAPDYAGIIEGMRFGKVHVAWFGNKSAMEAVDRAGGEIFAQQTHLDGTQGYYSHILVSASNDKINSLKDLLKCDGSLNFGMGDPNSTSGFLVPSYYVFAQNGVDPKKCFKTVRNANHETNLMAVANKQVDAASNNSEQMQRTEMKNPDAFKNVKIIWTSPLIPSDPMVYRKDLSKGLKDQIKAFFLSYGRLGAPEQVKKEKAVLAAMSDGLAPFTNSTNAQLYPIRQLALFKDKLKVEGDDRLAAADKNQKLTQIEQKLNQINLLVTAQ